MRVKIPDDIKRLGDLQIPYLCYSAEKGVHLSDDAPQEIIEARERFIKWMRENASDRG